MELSRGQQRLLFVALVIVLAGLGLYLVGPGRDHGSPSTASSSSSAPAVASTSPATAAPAVAPTPGAAPTPLPVPASFKNANIYSWLPFTQQDLDAAANVTVAFAAADETFTYTDTPATYGSRLSSLVTPTLLTTLEQGFAPADEVATWKQEHFSSKSAGVIDQITSFASSPLRSITFVVTITEQTTSNGKTTSTPGQYDVTAEAVAGGWQVNDIEQAGQGNQ